MKKVKKVMASIVAIGLIGSCIVVPAFASSYYHGAGSFTTKYSTSTEYFNSDPANKIRFIFQPTCDIGSAKVQVELHKRGVVPPVECTQYVPVNADQQQRPWWNSKDAHYHVQLHALNNETTTSSRKPISFSYYWFQNCSSTNPWV
ncbi:MAG: hypothetical protein ACLU8W_13410 [Clostridia bacterium]